MPHIWQLTALQLQNKTWLSGTLLEGPREKQEAPRHLWAHFRRVLLSYFKRPYAQQPLRIRYGEREERLFSSEKGFFSLQLDNPLEQPLQLLVGEEVLPVPENYPVFFPEREGVLEVISDIDDTVLRSHTASFFKRIGTILFAAPQKRATIAFSEQLLKHFHSSAFRVSYLSKSESNLFDLIRAVFHQQGLPKGPMFLTPHLRLVQLFSSKEKDYKLKHLRLLLKGLPHKRFILLGDDTQRDMDIYTQLIRQYGERIVKVYIRQTKRKRSSVQQDKWEALLETGVEALYFQDSDDAEQEIQALQQTINQLP